MSEAACPICAKHRGEGELVGPVIYLDDLVIVSHRPTGALGYVFLETRRHIGSVDQLTAEEAAILGKIRTQIAQALRAELDVTYLHAAVIGIAIPHFHEHVFVRHVGTPDDVAFGEVWADAPSGDLDEFAGRLARHLSS